jgi:hypothetical protein
MASYCGASSNSIRRATWCSVLLAWGTSFRATVTADLAHLYDTVLDMTTDIDCAEGKRCHGVRGGGMVPREDMSWTGFCDAEIFADKQQPSSNPSRCIVLDGLWSPFGASA